MKKIARKFPFLFGLVCFVVFYEALGVIKYANINSNLMQGLFKLLVSAIMIIIMWPVLKDKWLAFPGKNWGVTFKMARACLIAPIFVVLLPILVLFVSIFVPELNTGFVLNENWLIDSLGIAVSCIGIGVGEELVFRRAIFGCLLEQFKDKKHSVLILAILSSLFFGFVHVMKSIAFDPYTLISCLLKTIQSGVYGFILCGTLFEIGNLWPVSIIHFLSDFIPLFATTFNANSGDSSYVVSAESGSTGIAQLAIYVIYILICLPNAIRIFKKLKNINYKQ